jgi:predicted dehydrogenase
MVDQLKLGIVGFGWVARDYMVPAIRQSKQVILTAVCSAQTSDMIGLPNEVQQFTNLADMLQQAPIDAVYIATPNHLHCTQAVACLEAGRHVLCEKPMATTPKDAEAMVRSAQRSGKVYATAFDQRFHPAHRVIQQLVQNQLLGTITQVKIDYACWLPADWALDNWRIDRRKAGGGAIIDLAPHGLDLLETLLNDRIVELTLYAQRAVHSYAVDDGGVLLLRFARGTLGSVHVGYNRPETFPRRRLEIIGTERMLVAENTLGQEAGGALRLFRASGEREQRVPFNTKAQPFEQQISDFADQILLKRSPPRTPEDDLRLFNLLHHALAKADEQLQLHHAT